MFSLFIIVVMTIIVVIFSIQNAGSVAVSFLSWHFDASLAMVIALSFLAGMIIGMAILAAIRMSRSARKKKAMASKP
ncbi:MAG TPA: LapA family protein [Nitrospirota bacterium]|nr:LapA family protein [Nitrospirota bacterium]